MEKVKIIISGQSRAFIIPMEYDSEQDILDIKEFQVDPIPEENENLTKDIVINLAEFIVNCLTKTEKDNK